MKINMDNAPKFPNEGLEIGNVYRCKGGANSDQKFWVVVGLPRDRVVMLGIDNEGNIVSSADYGQHVFNCQSPYFTRGRDIVGRCKDMPALNFSVEWEPVS
jgi:hypothetical protein